jgi:rubrerythrin
MPELFKATEIVEMAVQEERNGVAYYEALAGKTADPKVKAFAERLAGEERRHEREFTELRNQLGGYVPAESFEGEYLAYVRALVNDRFLPSEEKAKETVRRAGTDRDVILSALRFEKETLLFFSEMKHFVPRRHAPVIDTLMGEERQHIADLSELLRTL